MAPWMLAAAGLALLLAGAVADNDHDDDEGTKVITLSILGEEEVVEYHRRRRLQAPAGWRGQLWCPI